MNIKDERLTIMRFHGLYLSLTAVVLCAGCVAPSPGRSRGYLDPEEDVYGRSSRLEYSQKRLTVTKSVERMLTDPMFTGNYDKARARASAAGRTLPTIAINPIENNTGDGRSDSAATGQLYRELLTAIRKTGRFVMIDRMRRKQMTDSNIGGVDSGEDGAGIQGVGDYTSADFVMTGDLRREVTEGESHTVYHHFLNLEMIDSASGTVFWSDTVPVVKFDAR